MASYTLNVHLDDDVVAKLEISYVTLMFFDTIVAELGREFGSCYNFKYEDDDFDRIAVRSDEDLPAFVSYLEHEGEADIWLVRNPSDDISDIPEILPWDLCRLDMLSHGQFGTVYRSIHMPTDHVLAVKCIAIGKDDERKDDVFRELTLMKKCSSCEYVVSLVGASVDSQSFYICLEYMNGGSIGDYGKLPLRVLLFTTRSIFEGLKFLWTNNIMHRDLKPNNVLVNTSGYVKITDLGISKIMTDSVTRTYVGTTMYMAPERIQGGVYRLESDVWSFGLLLWELALGYFPLQQSSDTLTVNSVPSFHVKMQRIENNPWSFSELIRGCLRRNVLQRWKLNDLAASLYIMEGWPIDREVISRFIIDFKS
ncbi:unnamed protein product [Cylicocyclus nassatus]|uniref:mitogen-activated protein kinase kinase n=1 Tax=Cylicocyclus nassatus TaxID=53992 RepID=A0AA36DW10_CYLNA|nr:unnamed protein product [Cylicocyclus nassatus]